MARAARRPLIRRYQPGDETRIAPPDREGAGFILQQLAVWDRYHRYSVVGLEHVPASGPALLVSFHSLTVIDMMLLGRRVFLRDGRMVRGLTDTLMFHIPGIRDVFSTLGILSGTPANGLAVLQDGQIAACMPGGGLEWSRPWSRRGEMRWGDHRGYARLAIRAGVPIIPTACPAADRAYIVPFDGWALGAALQRWLGLSRTVPLPVGLGLLGPIPFPVRLTQYVGAPIEPGAPPEAADDPAAVAPLDARVRTAIAELLRRR